MPTSTKKQRLLDAYRFSGFRPEEKVRGVFGDPLARVVTLVRRSKKRPAGRVAGCIRGGTTDARVGSVICPADRTGYSWSSRFGASIAEAAGP